MHDLLSSREVERYTEKRGAPIRAGTLANWRIKPNGGPLPFKKIGGRIFYVRRAVDQLLGLDPPQESEAEDGR